MRTDEDDGPWIDEPILFLDQFQLPQELLGSGCPTKYQPNQVLRFFFSFFFAFVIFFNFCSCLLHKFSLFVSGCQTKYQPHTQLVRWSILTMTIKNVKGVSESGKQFSQGIGHP